MHFRAQLLTVILITFSTGLYAQPIDVEQAGFSAQAQAIRDELVNGTKYKEISDEDRTEVLSLLSNMEARLGNLDTDDLSQPAKIAIFNDQERINTILIGAEEDSRLVCQRAQTTGTRMSRSSCQTVAERRRQVESGRDQLRDMQQRMPIHTRER